MNNHRILVLAIALTLPALAVATNYGFLKGGPSSKFTDEDTSLMMKAADEALNDASPTAKREWQNPATGNSGQVEALSPFELADGTTCRKLRLHNVAKSTENRATHTLCKSPKNIWMIRPDAKPK
jgi:surface antigen